MEYHLLKYLDTPDVRKIDVYESIGGYTGLKNALTMKSDEILSQMKKSGLRGRGGAGFPTAIKWTTTATDPATPKYVICNADEGEPGTFKDKVLLELNPHQIIEGMIIAAHTVGAKLGYVYLRGEYPGAFVSMQAALDEARSRGYLGPDALGAGLKFNLHLHKGAGAYICGEESALIESLEGKRGQPRVKPPRTANKGFMRKPTTSNNAETFANVPLIMSMGADAYASIGTKESPGPKLFSVSGHVEKPGVYEAPMGISLHDLIYDLCGGIKGGRKLKGVIPGGVSTPILTQDKIDCPMDFVSVSECGSMLGSGAVIVFDETTCMVRVAMRIARFFEHESCGKCTPCREGCGWLRAILERIENGNGHMRDLDLLLEVADNIEGRSFCALGDGASMSARSFVYSYRSEFEAHIKEQRCAFK